MTYEERRLRHVEAMNERAVPSVERLGWDAASLEVERERRLRRLVAHALERSAWQGDRLRRAGVDASTVTEQSLREVPLMTKADLMDHFDDIVADERVTLEVAEKHLETSDVDPYLFGSLHVCVSGGTSGRRGVFVWDWDGWVEAFLGMARRSFLRPIGVEPPHRMVSVAGGSALHMSSAITRTFTNPQRVITRVAATLPFESIVEQVEAAQPQILQGYPSMLHRLALEAAAGRLSIVPLSIVGGSEVLTAETQTLFIEVWNAPVDDLYATTDVGPIASTCEHGHLHLCDDLVIVEAVDQNGDAVEDGVEGDRLLVTGLLNLAEPLIRYELDDRVTISPESCPCGSAHRVLDSIRGRTADVFEFDDGVLHPVTLSAALGADRTIADWRVTRTPTGLLVQVVPGGHVDLDAVRRGVSEKIVAAGLVGITIDVSSVEHLDRPASGKARRYITAPPTGPA